MFLELLILALTALWYDEHSLVHEATIEYENLVKLAPKNAAFHAKLTALYQKTGHLEDSERERTKAEQLGFEFEFEEVDKKK
jgi:Tfp pilus assembly protein PilF